MKPIRVLYGITKSNFGGAQRYVFDLAVEAKKAGHDVAVMCGGEGPLVQKLKSEGIRVISLPSLGRDVSVFSDLKTFFEIKNILKEIKPDVFHINSSKMGLGAFAARIVGIKKIIFTAHGWAFNEPRLFLSKLIIKELIWYTILLSHKTICVSKKTKRDVSWMPFIKNKLVVIYNGIARFDLAMRTDQTFTVGAVAELHKIKGLDILLNAWGKFTKIHRARLVIFGAGEEKQNLENLISKLKIVDSVELKGFVDSARSQLSTFDIFVMPSRSEAMPYALLEAGFAGLPVVASSVGGIPGIIKDGENGILVQKENVEQLVSALARLADNKELRDKLGANLKQTVSEKFSFEKMIKETFRLYSSK